MKTRADQIFERFAAFHKANPIVWRLFRRLALRRIDEGFNEYSAKKLFEDLRWHFELDTTGDKVRLCNSYTAYYARMFHVAYPHLKGFFRCRRIVSSGKRAYTNEPEIDMSPPEEEDELKAAIKELIDP